MMNDGYVVYGLRSYYGAQRTLLETCVPTFKDPLPKQESSVLRGHVPAAILAPFTTLLSVPEQQQSPFLSLLSLARPERLATAEYSLFQTLTTESRQSLVKKK